MVDRLVVRSYRFAWPWTASGDLVVVHVPLNDGIKAAGNPDRITDLAAVRGRFDELTWVRWNIVRAVASTAVLGCLTWALVEYGRTVL